VNSRVIALLSVTMAVAVPSAHADRIGISANDINWDTAASPDVSPDITVALTNSLVDNMDRLAGWQLRLQVVPTGGATGSVNFHADFLPFDGSYILQGRSFGLAGGIDASDQTKLFDFDSDSNVPPTGVNVPAMGKTLLSVNFFTNDMAHGEFLLQAVGGIGDTQWSDGNSMDRAFHNIAFGTTQTIAHINANFAPVPEPSVWVLAGIGLPVIVSLVRRRLRLLRS
jgi:hypothetical protein